MGINLSKVNFSYNPSKKKNKTIYTLKDIDLNIDSENEFITILGHTGSGKSTLVQLFNALNMPTNGKEQIFDIEINNKAKLKPIRKRVGLVFQFSEYQIFEETVLKDIMFGPKNFGLTLEEAKEKAIEAAKLMKIDDLLERSPFSLSGGQMRKVAIAGILASDPSILVLDEPTVGLDPNGKKELLEILRKLNEESHKTIIIITHDMDVVSAVSKRCLVLSDGEIVFDGEKDALFRNKEVIEKYSLGYPSIVELLIKLNEKYKYNLDVYQYTINDAYLEIKKKVGKANE